MTVKAFTPGFDNLYNIFCTDESYKQVPSLIPTDRIVSQNYRGDHREDVPLLPPFPIVGITSPCDIDR